MCTRRHSRNQRTRWCGGWATRKGRGFISRLIFKLWGRLAETPGQGHLRALGSLGPVPNEQVLSRKRPPAWRSRRQELLQGVCMCAWHASARLSSAQLSCYMCCSVAKKIKTGHASLKRGWGRGKQGGRGGGGDSHRWQFYHIPSHLKHDLQGVPDPHPTWHVWGPECICTHM